MTSKVPFIFYNDMLERSCHFDLAVGGLCLLKLHNREGLRDEVCLSISELLFPSIFPITPLGEVH